MTKFRDRFIDTQKFFKTTFFGKVLISYLSWFWNKLCFGCIKLGSKIKFDFAPEGKKFSCLLQLQRPGTLLPLFLLLGRKPPDEQKNHFMESAIPSLPRGVTFGIEQPTCGFSSSYGPDWLPTRSWDLRALLVPSPLLSTVSSASPPPPPKTRLAREGSQELSEKLLLSFSFLFLPLPPCLTLLDLDDCLLGSLLPTLNLGATGASL